MSESLNSINCGVCFVRVLVTDVVAVVVVVATFPRVRDGELAASVRDGDAVARLPDGEAGVRLVDGESTLLRVRAGEAADRVRNGEELA